MESTERLANQLVNTTLYFMQGISAGVRVHVNDLQLEDKSYEL